MRTVALKAPPPEDRTPTPDTQSRTLNAAQTRFRAHCAYDGTAYHGWQSQRGGNTIQDFIEARLAEIFKQPVRIHASGRTDAGVHAKEQVFHFDAPAWEHPVSDLARALRTGLPGDIQIWKVARAPAGFHGRYSVTGKRYVYRLYKGHAPPMEARYCWSLGERAQAIDIDAMREAASRLIGEHDFSAFGALRGDTSDSRDNPVKDLRRLDVRARGRRLTVTTEASGYLYKMVRSLVGALVEVGLGKLTPEQIAAILESRQRTEQIPTAPAKGLCLEKVWYH